MLNLTDEDFLRLVDFMKSNYGINLEKKRILIEGRLNAVVTEKGFANFKDYIDYALSDKTGTQTIALVNKLTTNHTFFMREPEHFEFMRDTVLPYIESTVTDRDARIWCAAASTGQEPYTMAMVIDDYFGARKKGWDLKILATDLDTDVLRKAKLGVYSDESVSDLPGEWVDRYFKKIDKETYQISDEIRDEIVYKKFNLMNPIKYIKPFDLIVCRNVMIYFENETKNALIERFYDCTKDGGYLFIGHAENVSKDTRYKYIKPAIYRKQ